MSGIINSVESKSGVIGRKEMSVIRWRLYGDPGTNALDPLGATSDWIVSDGVSESPVEFACGVYGSPTLVTEASGIFSFTETGYYHIASHAAARQTAANSRWIKCNHLLSDNGTSGTYTVVTTGFANQLDNHWGQIALTSLVKVTDVSNDKFKLSVDRETANTVWLNEGTAGVNLTYVDFIKLGML